MINLAIAIKQIKIKYQGTIIHFKIKKLSVGVRNYVTSLMLSGTKIDTKNPNMIEGLTKWKNPNEADEIERQVLLNGVKETNLKDDKGDNIEWDLQIVNELLEKYPDLATKLYQEVWNFNNVNGESL